jgi:hypothetical protein
VSLYFIPAPGVGESKTELMLDRLVEAVRKAGAEVEVAGACPVPP